MREYKKVNRHNVARFIIAAAASEANNGCKWLKVRGGTNNYFLLIEYAHNPTIILQR
jgi:hypothetical protein